MKKCEEIVAPAPKPKNIQQRAAAAWIEWKAEKKAKKQATKTAKNARRNAKRKAKKRQLKIWSMSYREYIDSPEWKAFVAALIKERGSVCEECKTAGPVQGHHLTYHRLRGELKRDVQLLCRTCHATRHEKKPRAVNDAALYKEFAAIVGPPE